MLRCFCMSGDQLGLNRDDLTPLMLAATKLKNLLVSDGEDMRLLSMAAEWTSFHLALRAEDMS